MIIKLGSNTINTDDISSISDVFTQSYQEHDLHSFTVRMKTGYEITETSKDLKEMAEKILSAKEDTNFGSQDLKVGGKGIKPFHAFTAYFKLLPC